MILRAELDELARRRGVEVHYVLGDHRDERAAVGPSTCSELVPDIADARRLRLRPAGDDRRDAARACGAPGVPRRQIITERFAL